MTEQHCGQAQATPAVCATAFAVGMLICGFGPTAKQGTSAPLRTPGAQATATPRGPRLPRRRPSPKTHAPATPLYQDWRTVAQADLIVAGLLEVPRAAITHAHAAGRNRYVGLRLTEVQPLKGSVTGRTLTTQYYTESVPYAPAPKDVVALHGKRVLAFVAGPSDLESGGTGYYFASASPSALQAYGDRMAKLVRREIAEQQRVLERFSKLPAAQPDAYDEQVRQLIAQMRNPKLQAQAFTRLEKLGKPAVPSIIRHMDDRHRLPKPYIALQNNWPGAFEAIRQYGPKVVVDALAAILNQITSESFGDIHNGGSDRARAATVQGWRIYLYYGCRPEGPTDK